MTAILSTIQNKPGKRIIFLRHAHAAKKNTLLGSFDEDLDKIGKEQARVFFTTYRKMGFDKIYTSTLKRAYNTVKHFAVENIPIEVMEGLDEVSWGEIENKKISGETRQQHLSVINAWKNKNDLACTVGGENMAEIRSRISNTINYIISKTHEKNILIVTHSRILKIILCLILHIEIGLMDTFKHSNMSMYVINYSEGVFDMISKIEWGTNENKNL